MGALADVSENECDSVLRQILAQLFENASSRSHSNESERGVERRAETA